MSAETELAKQWLAKARNDLLSADNNLRAAEVPYDTVCFHGQQAAEKLLKAFLVAHGQEPPLTHDLEDLLERILPLATDVECLRPHLAALTPYAVGVRYPDDSFTPSRADAEEARAAAETVLTWLKKSLPRLFTPA